MGILRRREKYFERVAKGNVWVTWGFIGSEMELVRATRRREALTGV